MGTMPAAKCVCPNGTHGVSTGRPRYFHKHDGLITQKHRITRMVSKSTSEVYYAEEVLGFDDKWKFNRYASEIEFLDLPSVGTQTPGMDALISEWSLRMSTGVKEPF